MKCTVMIWRSWVLTPVGLNLGCVVPLSKSYLIRNIASCHAGLQNPAKRKWPAERGIILIFNNTFQWIIKSNVNKFIDTSVYCDSHNCLLFPQEVPLKCYSAVCWLYFPFVAYAPSPVGSAVGWHGMSFLRPGIVKQHKTANSRLCCGKQTSKVEWLILQTAVLVMFLK